MVRSNELGCRNGWNADLWVPAVADGSDRPSHPHEAIGDRAASEVEPAAQSDLITSIVAAKTDNHTIPEAPPRTTIAQSRVFIEEDIVVGQSPSLTWSTGPISAQPATELVQDPKAAILRARDQFRQRRKTEGRLVDREIENPSAPLLASSREARSIAERDFVEPEAEPQEADPRFENRPLLRPRPAPVYQDRRPVSPVKLDEIERPFTSMTDFPEDRARFESVPRIAEPAEPDAYDAYAEGDTWLETRQLDTVPPEPYLIDELFDEDEVAFAEEPAPIGRGLPVPHRESTLNRLLRQRRERRHLPEIQDDYRGGAIAPQLPQDPPLDAAPYAEPPYRPEARMQVDPAQTRSAPPSIQFEDDFELPPPLPELRPAETVQATAASGAQVRRSPRSEPDRGPEPRHRIETPVPDEFGDQPLFAANSAPTVVDDYEILPSYDTPGTTSGTSYRMERICQTCRDFRPTDNGERGWCNNKWAFNHRRMVDADDLACRNSLGSWWTPKDDIWRRDGDISRHAQQTPRVDQWLFGLNPDDQRGRRSGS